jgi:uncharacterized protein with HEPN domain
MREYALRSQNTAARRSGDDPVHPVARLAVERALEIVGEAARQLPPTYRAAHPEVPWRDIIGMRNILAHGYASVEDAIIWRTVAVRIPQLLEQLERLIQEEPESSA